MNVSETLQIIAALKSSGATHFKSQDFEISLGKAAMHEPLFEPSPVATPAQAGPSPSVQENKDATEKLKSLINTLALPPEQLVDVIFPAGAGG